MTQSHSDASWVFMNNYFREEEKSKHVHRGATDHLLIMENSQFNLYSRKTIFKTLNIEFFRTVLYLDHCGGYTNL